MARVLVACEMSGRVRRALVKAGHDAWSIDLLPSMAGIGRHVQGDAIHDGLLAGRPYSGEPWDAVVAFPPCTHLASSGARWWPEKQADGRQQAAEEFFMALATADVPFIAVENPVGRMSTAWRKPDQIVQPWWFGDDYTKSTCFWLKGFPPLQATNPVHPARGSWIHRLPPSPDRAMLRSLTPPGLAEAIGQQWGAFLHEVVQ